MAYARDTSVPVSRSEDEIKSVVRRYGASSYASFEDDKAAMIAFEMRGRRVVFRLPLPDPRSAQFTETPSGKWARSEKQAAQAYEQACRSRWRALLLCIKAKLEAVEAGIETFEDAFLAHIQMPDGSTVGQHVRPAIAQAYATNTMQPLLPGPRSS